MKIRNGFVSNSSSSSFICEITGEEFEIFDYVFRDSPLCKCTNEHIFKREYLIPIKLVELAYPDRDMMLKQLNKVIDSKKECELLKYLCLEDLKKRYEQMGLCNSINESSTNCIREDQCPICQLVHINDRDILDFVYKVYRSKPALIKEIKQRFFNYKNFKKFLGEK